MPTFLISIRTLFRTLPHFFKGSTSQSILDVIHSLLSLSLQTAFDLQRGIITTTDGILLCLIRIQSSTSFPRGYSPIGYRSLFSPEEFYSADSYRSSKILCSPKANEKTPRGRGNYNCLPTPPSIIARYCSYCYSHACHHLLFSQECTMQHPLRPSARPRQAPCPPARRHQPMRAAYAYTQCLATTCFEVTSKYPTTHDCLLVVVSKAASAPHPPPPPATRPGPAPGSRDALLVAAGARPLGRCWSWPPAPPLVRCILALLMVRCALLLTSK